MIKKILHIKIIFKTYLKNIKNKLTIFQIPKHLFCKISKNSF